MSLVLRAGAAAQVSSMPVMNGHAPAAGDSMDKLRTIVVDDHRAFRTLAGALLEDHPAIEVIAFGESGEEAVELCERHKPNLKLDTPEYNVNINYDTPKPAYSAPTYPNPAYSAPTYNPPTNYPQPSYGYQAPAAGVPYLNWQAMYTQFSISAGHSQAAYPSTYSAPTTWAKANNLSYGG